jgi:hypothetical protein
MQCYTKNVTINVPYNTVQTDSNNPSKGESAETLLKMFKEGYRIELEPLHEIKTPSCDYPIDFTFYQE